MRWTIRLIGVFSVAILARLLAPADFGIVAMAMIVAGLLDTAAYTGVNLALIREKADTNDYLDSAWTIQLLQATLIAGLLVIVAPLAADYYREPRVATVIFWLAGKSLIDGFQNIGVVAFQKELDFPKEFRFNVYGRALNLIASIGAAVALRNYMALVVGMVSGGVITVILSYVMHPYRPRVSFTKVRQLWSFSNWLLVSRIGSFLTRKADQFLIGGVVGASALGNYHVATEVSTMPTGETVMPLRRALFPALSKLQDDPVAFRAAVLQSFSTLAIVSVALGFGVMVTAEQVVPIVLGPQWLAAIPLIQWLAVYGTFTALTSILEVPMWVNGKTRLSALQSWLELVLLVPCIWASVRYYGIDGAAISRAGIAALLLPFMMYLASRVCPIGFRDLAFVLWRPFAGGLLMIIVLSLPMTYPAAAWLSLLIKIALGAVIYVGALVLFWVASGKPDGIEAAALQRIGMTGRGALP